MKIHKFIKKHTDTDTDWHFDKSCEYLMTAYTITHYGFET